MIKTKSANILIGTMNLLAVGTPMLASQSLHLALTDKKIEQANFASIKSIESSWLKVPVACKARGFNASPISLETKEIASHIQNIYSLYQG